jgi:hypothetical protein
MQAATKPSKPAKLRADGVEVDRTLTVRLRESDRLPCPATNRRAPYSRAARASDRNPKSVGSAAKRLFFSMLAAWRWRADVILLLLAQANKSI